MTICSAPGKIILFGEHAVVFGEPALATAINRRIRISGRTSSEPTLDGRPLWDEKKPYVRTCVEMAWSGDPLELNIESHLPPAAGMGSSAAVSVATLGLISGLQGKFSTESIARMGFEVELKVQGRASPIDTTTSSQGKGVFVTRQHEEGFLWLIEKEDRRWFLHSRDIPRMRIVVGDTGIKGETGPLVDHVKRLVERSEHAADVVREIGRITIEGVQALKDEDFTKVGKLMTKNHGLLNELGVGHELLDRYIDAVLPVSYGAKLTGAGGGGSMIALTEDPDEVAARITELGGKSYIVETEGVGARLEND